MHRMRNFPVNSLYLEMSDPVLASIADATCKHAPMGDPTSHFAQRCHHRPAQERQELGEHHGSLQVQPIDLGPAQ